MNDDLINKLSRIKSDDEVTAFAKLTPPQRQQEFKRSKRIVFTALTIILGIFVAFSVIFFTCAFLVDVWILQLFFNCIGALFGLLTYKTVEGFYPFAKSIYNATYYDELDEAFFSNDYWAGETFPAEVVSIASRTYFELQQVKQYRKEAARENGETEIELLQLGPVIGTIDGVNILQFVIVKKKSSGETFTLKYAGYSATEPVERFLQIATEDQVGYIYDNVIYL